MRMELCRYIKIRGKITDDEIHTSTEVVPTSAAHDLLDSTLRGGQLERRFCDPLRTVVADSNQSKTEYKRDKATNGPLDGHEGPRLYGNRNQQRRLCSAPAVLTHADLLRPHFTSIRPPIRWWPFILSWSISIDSIKLESGRFYPQICV